MAEEILSIDRGDLLYPVKFIIAEKVEAKFPIERVVEVMKRYEFYEEIKKDSWRISANKLASSTTLSRDNIVCQVTEAEVSFSEELADEEIERIKAELHSLLVSRVEILLGAAEQNASSALINLLQNQRRACVSDMYYALHNLVSAIVEYIIPTLGKGILQLPPELSRESTEEESRLAHCSPAVCRPIISMQSLEFIWSSNTNEILSSRTLKAQKNAKDREPHRSPFIWLAILIKYVFLQSKVASSEENFSTKFDTGERKDLQEVSDFREVLDKVAISHYEVLLDLVGQIEEKISKLELDAYGLGGKNEAVESDFKLLHHEISELLGELTIDGEKTDFMRAILLLSEFLVFGQILRLSGDYDASFEIKIRQQDIVDWTLITNRFVPLIRNILEKRSMPLRSSIKFLPTRCDHRLLGINDQFPIQKKVSSFGGAIQAPHFSLVNVVRQLHYHHGYNLTGPDGRTQRVRNGSNEITIWKPIPSYENLICFLTIHSSGLFWVEVVHRPFDKEIDRYKKPPFNNYYLNLIIDEKFLKDDLLSTLSPRSTIFRALSETFYEEEEHGYAYLLTNLLAFAPHLNLIGRIIDKVLDERAEEKEGYSYQKIWIRSRFDLTNRYLRPLNSHSFFEPERNRETSKGIIILVIPLISLSTSDQEQLTNLLSKRFDKDLNGKTVSIEFISSEALDKALLGDTTFLEAIITTNINKRKERDSIAVSSNFETSSILNNEGTLLQVEINEEE